MRKTRIKNLSKLPGCDICAQAPCKYDAKTFMGSWAYMCQECFEKFGVGLGLGKGQEIVGVENESK